MEPKEENIKVKISFLESKPFILSLKPSDTVANVETRIVAAENLPRKRFNYLCLIFEDNNKKMSEEKTLSYYGVKDGSALKVKLKLTRMWFLEGVLLRPHHLGWTWDSDDKVEHLRERMKPHLEEGPHHMDKLLMWARVGLGWTFKQPNGTEEED